MSVRSGPALYAPIQAVTRFLDANAGVRSADSVSLQSLRDIGTPDSVAARCLHALEHLGLIAADGVPTERLTRFRAAQGLERQEVLAEALRSAYPEVFAALPDLDRATQPEIEAAFSIYEPATQRHRMVRLFYGLASYAGLVKGRPPRLRVPAVERPPTAETPRSSSEGSGLPGELESHTVEFVSGGYLSLSLAVRLFDLSVEDRTFVLDIIDRFREYNSQSNTGPK